MRGSSRPHSCAARAVALAWMATMSFACSASPKDDWCDYPAGSYGYAPGDVLPPTLSWSGVTEAGRTSTVSIADYQDCDGSRGINALLIDQSAAWCGPCQRLAATISGNLHNGWRGSGIHVLTLITQSPDMEPATVETAMGWRRRFGLDHTAVAADPQRSLRDTAGEEAAPYPYHLVIDPRTMSVVEASAGFRGEGDFATLVELARKNAR